MMGGAKKGGGKGKKHNFHIHLTSTFAGKKIKVQRLEYLGRYRDAPKQTWPMICDRQSAQLPTMVSAMTYNL